MDLKSWFKSKTIVSDILTILVAAYLLVQHNFIPSLPAPPPNFVETALTILGSIGIFGRVTANTKIG